MSSNLASGFLLLPGRDAEPELWQGCCAPLQEGRRVGASPGAPDRSHGPGPKWGFCMAAGKGRALHFQGCPASNERWTFGFEHLPDLPQDAALSPAPACHATKGPRPGVEALNKRLQDEYVALEASLHGSWLSTSGQLSTGTEEAARPGLLMTDCGGSSHLSSSSRHLGELGKAGRFKARVATTHTLKLSCSLNASGAQGQQLAERGLTLALFASRRALGITAVKLTIPFGQAHQNC